MRLLGLAALGFASLLAGCASETLLSASFNSDAAGSPPAVNQTVGTLSTQPGAGSVLVVGPPPGASSNWVRISHPSAPTPETVMIGNLSQFRGNGTYNILGSLYIPSGTGVATLQFDPFGFLHLDFMPNNTVRIDDSSTVFGTFPRDQVFTVAVTLTISDTAVAADMQLFGTGASGSLSYNVQPAMLNAARQFNAVRVWMGFQHTGSFDADDILVLYRKP